MVSLRAPLIEKVLWSSSVSVVSISTLYSDFIFLILSPPFPMIFAAICFEVVSWVVSSRLSFAALLLSFLIVMRRFLLTVGGSFLLMASVFCSATISADYWSDGARLF